MGRGYGYARPLGALSALCGPALLRAQKMGYPRAHRGDSDRSHKRRSRHAAEARTTPPAQDSAETLGFPIPSLNPGRNVRPVIRAAASLNRSGGGARCPERNICTGAGQLRVRNSRASSKINVPRLWPKNASGRVQASPATGTKARISELKSVKGSRRFVSRPGS